MEHEVRDEIRDRLREIKEGFVVGLMEEIEFSMLDMRESIGELRHAINALLTPQSGEEKS